MKNLHVLKVRVLSPTDTLGTRVRIVSEFYKDSVVLSYDYRYNSATEMAVEYLKEKGFNIIGKSSDYIISDTFETIK